MISFLEGRTMPQWLPKLTILDNHSLFLLSNVDIGSIASKMAVPMSPIYSTAKAAMDTLSYAASMQVRLGLF